MSIENKETGYWVWSPNNVDWGLGMQQVWLQE